MNPTLLLTHTRTTDAIAFECDHARTEAFLPDNEGEGPLAEALQYVMATHATDCACQPEAVIDEWPSLAEALSVFEADAEADRAAGRVRGELESVAHGLAIESMRRYACSTCDPAFSTIARRGILEHHVVHKAGCPRATSPYPRSTRVLDLGAPLGGVA
ncbi:MAG: hypothetical protein M0Z49_16190 [Chloroflexi bacterium]|nr:hypothetical protein [Chloroflexota bacterium]